MNVKAGRPKNPPKYKKMLKDIIPVKDIFLEEELPIYEGLVDIYMKDIEVEDMSSGDMDNIMSLAMNRVLEFRLLKSSKNDTDKQLDISASVEKLHKQNEKLRESLSIRRRDRINPNEFKGFSIVDLAVSFDDERKNILSEKTKQLKEEEKIIKERRKDYVGNRRDLDVEKLEDEVN